ncbi:isoprenylcysteine carboxyl methyltransferase family protein [Vulgatibacter sp.]|uniref:isoprenylcysteine carboxyl methyltransferase family protein n=1 Tax=Vulgatibacter sp. TaxID=1971226 RepID=UPI003564F9F1
MVNLYLGFLLLLGVERIGELVLSRRNAARSLADGGVEVGQRHFRAMALLHTAFLFACAAEVVLFERRFPGALGTFAFGVAILAQALRYWAIGTLGPRWNVRVIVVPGEAPVTSGPYRFVRHPNYVAVVLEILFVPLIHGAWITALLFSAANAVLLYVRIRTEEAALGAAYRAAFAERPRFLPGGKS